MNKKLFFLLFFGVGVLFAKPIAVNTTLVKVGALQQQENFVGNVVFKEIANIASQSNGAVEEVYFRLGQHIKKGDKLLSLNDELLQKDIIIKQAKLDQAQYVLEKKKKELERYKNLLETQSIPLQQYENIAYEVKSQEATILALQTELDISILDLGRKVIYAPFDGIVVDQKVHRGEWIKSGEVICQVLNTKDVEVVADIPSFMISNLALGQMVSAKINNKTYRGKVIAIIPKADINSRNFPVYISIEGDDMLLDGMPATIKLNVSKKNTGFLIPRDSIVQKNGKTSVFIVRGNKAVLVEVNILSVNRGEVLVNGKIKENEKIVLRGQDKLENGSEIKEVG